MSKQRALEDRRAPRAQTIRWGVWFRFRSVGFCSHPHKQANKLPQSEKDSLVFNYPSDDTSSIRKLKLNQHSYSCSFHPTQHKCKRKYTTAQPHLCCVCTCLTCKTIETQVRRANTSASSVISEKLFNSACFHGVTRVWVCVCICVAHCKSRV